MNNYLKYFKNLDLYKSLAGQIARGEFVSSHLFVCEDEFSAKAFGLIVANLLLCENLTACGVCSSCVKVLPGTHADLYVLPKDKKFVVSDAHYIIENAYTKPINSNKKVFLINNFENANQASQNKILKILEEANKNVFFLLSATSENSLLPTINSRVQKHFIPRFEMQELKKILNENFSNYNQSALWLSEGFLGKALAFLQDKEFLKNYNFVLDVLTNMKQSKDIFRFTNSMAEKSSFVLKLEILEKIFRNILAYNNAKSIMSEGEKLVVMPYAEEFSNLAVISILNRILKAKTHFDFNVSTGVIADNLLVGILEDKFLYV